MNFWQRLNSNLLFGACKVVGWLPAWLLYGPLHGLIYFVLYRVVHYRKAVVQQNLRNSFPGMDAATLRYTKKEYYRHLAELFVDTISMASISRKEMLRRIHITGLEEHEAEVAGKDWIAAMTHYGTWEYFFAYQLLCPAQVIGTYRPLSDKVFDDYYRRVRTRFGMQVVPSAQLIKAIVRHRQGGRGNIAVGMIADQKPPWVTNKWFHFLNQPTPFYEGPARLALRFGMPVYFLHITKIKKAHYEGRFERIYDGHESLTEDQITARYAALLQRDILSGPPYWIWSHRRWKHGPGPGETVDPLPEI